MITDVWTETYIQDLSEEDLKNFQDIVLKDVKNRSFNDMEKYVLNNNLDLWLYSLRVLRREIELQLSQHKTNLKIKVRDLIDSKSPQNKIEDLMITEENWRNNAMKFLTSIERKTLYVKLLIDDQDKD
jgi:UDP-N-acetylglucosamine pyrophosphorylase